MKNLRIMGLALSSVSTLCAAPLSAQDAPASGAVPTDVLAMTCADLVGLDTGAAADVIHYIAGYRDGQRATLAAAGPAGTDMEAADSTGTAGTGSGAGEQTEGGDVSLGEATRGNEGSPDSEIGSGEASANAATQVDSGAGQSLEIAVDRIMAACADAADSPASEVISVSRGASQPEVDLQDEDPAAEGEEGQDVGSGNAVVE